MPRLKSNLVSVYVLRESAAGVELLMLQRPDDYVFPGDWQAVHGHVEPDETGWQAALREVREETGLSPDRWYRLFQVETFYNPENDSIYLVPVFVAAVDADADCRISDEHQACAWRRLTQARAAFSWETQRQTVDALLTATVSWPDAGPGLMIMEMDALNARATRRAATNERSRSGA